MELRLCYELSHSSPQKDGAALTARTPGRDLIWKERHRRCDEFR